jgi:hypothetical protein
MLDRESNPSLRLTMPKRELPVVIDTSSPAVSISDLSLEQAYSTGAAVGKLINGGLPACKAVGVTTKIADFIRRGQNAQAAVDAILSVEAKRRRTKKPMETT